MNADRREFLKHVGWISAAGAGVFDAAPALAAAPHHGGAVDDTQTMGVLVDLTECIGCRLCERACKVANDIEPGTVASYEDHSVFERDRRPGPDAFTILNRAPNPADPAKPIYTKFNCMHCNYPACVSACIVGAMEKQPNGAVTYDAWKCIGCRYCMVACPFQLPAYSYDVALTPQIRKCQFCFTRISHGELPACVKACPRQALTIRKRGELLELAHNKISRSPA